MRRTLLVRLAIVGSLCIAVPSAAQARLPIAGDQRVRVWTDAADAITGRVTGVTPNAVLVAVDGREPATLAVATIRRVEVSRSQTSRGAGFKKGAIRGAIIMAAIGAVSLGLQHDTVGEDGASVGEAVALGVWSGGLFGGLIGGAIGAARAGDRWEQVWP
ncbi:MAG TPA: hypothetical protein VFZ38_04485 [Vicinamibacterales bacterium]